jgi:hypothetical protein
MNSIPCKREKLLELCCSIIGQNVAMASKSSSCSLYMSPMRECLTSPNSKKFNSVISGLYGLSCTRTTFDLQKMHRVFLESRLEYCRNANVSKIHEMCSHLDRISQQAYSLDFRRNILNCPHLVRFLNL